MGQNRVAADARICASERRRSALHLLYLCRCVLCFSRQSNNGGFLVDSVHVHRHAAVGGRRGVHEALAGGEPDRQSDVQQPARPHADSRFDVASDESIDPIRLTVSLVSSARRTVVWLAVCVASQRERPLERQAARACRRAVCVSVLTNRWRARLVDPEKEERFRKWLEDADTPQWR